MSMGGTVRPNGNAKNLELSVNGKAPSQDSGSLISRSSSAAGMNYEVGAHKKLKRVRYDQDNSNASHSDDKDDASERSDSDMLLG
jgi:hypothetical protein